MNHKQYYGETEKALFLRLQQAKGEVMMHLADDFSIPEALRALQELVREANKYMDTTEEASTILLRYGRNPTSDLPQGLHPPLLLSPGVLSLG